MGLDEPLTDIAPLIQEIQRRTAILVLRDHPEWALADLDAHMRSDGPYSGWIGQVTLDELCDDAGPPTRLARARLLGGPEFDAIVHQVLVEAGRFVGATYLRARVGGPRWKLQSSLSRLVRAGHARRKGTTSSTIYEGVS